MDNNTKVMLSECELALANDKQIILTKQAITAKAAVLLNEQIPALTRLFQEVFTNDEILLSAIPKISKGENYEGFPYVMMDYPASFNKQNIFALRTMFWWGNFISITLHLKGKYKEMYALNILAKITEYPDLYVSISNNEWQHNLDEVNYMKSELIKEKCNINFEETTFFKVALKYELHHWNMMQWLLPEGYNKIKNLLVS